MAAITRWSGLQDGSFNRLSPSKIHGGIPSISTLAFDSAFTFNSAGDCFAGWWLAQETGTLTDVWVYVSSYTGTWASTDGVINGSIREGMLSTFVPGTVVGSAFTITLDGITPNCWVKKSGLSIPVSAGHVYSLVIGDADGGATNYVTMNWSNGCTPVAAATMNGTYSTGGFASGNNQFTGTMLMVKYSGLLHPLSALLDEMTTTPSGQYERGMRFKPDEDVIWCGMGGYPDVGVCYNDNHLFKIYPDSSAPGGPTLGTYANQAGSLGGTAPSPPANIFSRSSHLFLPGGRWYRFIMKMFFDFTVPRKIRHFTNATIDADIQTAALAWNGNCYWTEEVPGSPGTWLDDPRGVSNVSPIFIPASTYPVRPSLNLGI